MKTKLCMFYFSKRLLFCHHDSLKSEQFPVYPVMKCPFKIQISDYFRPFFRKKKHYTNKAFMLTNSTKINKYIVPISMKLRKH